MSNDKTARTGSLAQALFRAEFRLTDFLAAEEAEPLPPPLFHQAIVKPHQLLLVVKLEHQLAGSNLRLLPQNNSGPEVALELLERLSSVCVQVRRGRGIRLLSLRASRRQLFDLADRQRPADGGRGAERQPQRDREYHHEAENEFREALPDLGRPDLVRAPVDMMGLDVAEE